jgi:poly-gamma-glutamate capsule biosynthesis protein CapA/YwtB (metallophosphatase superfamily)
VNRRDFLVRISAAAAALTLARRARAASEPSARASAAAPDSAAEALPPAMPVALVAAAGDTTLGYNLEAHFDEQAASGLSHDLLYSMYFAEMRAILQWADLALVNLECPFTERGEPLPKNFNFRARRELVEVLKEGAVGAVTLANNHLMDYGAQGCADTIETLDTAHILHFGAGADLEAARRPLIAERVGVKLGFLGYYYQDARDMREPRELYATKNQPGVAGCYTDLACMRDMLEQDVAKLAPQVDAVIPFFHWGHEGSTEVRDYQIELAHRAVDLGCRAVLGAHPHRFQGVEVYRDAPIFYSLGNFVFGGNKDPEDKLSAIVRLRVPKTGAVDADLVPIQITRWPESPFQPFPLEGDEKLIALARIAALSSGFKATLPQLVAAAAAPIPPTGATAPDSARADSSFAPRH